MTILQNIQSEDIIIYGNLKVGFYDNSIDMNGKETEATTYLIADLIKGNDTINRKATKEDKEKYKDAYDNYLTKKKLLSSSEEINDEEEDNSNNDSIEDTPEDEDEDEEDDDSESEDDSDNDSQEIINTDQTQENEANEPDEKVPKKHLMGKNNKY